MCGIAALLEVENDSVKRKLAEQLSRRGPDSQNSLAIGNTWIFSSVLHIQGNVITQQPYIDKDENILLWNGEVFGGLAFHKPGDSDTVAVANLLLDACGHLTNNVGECIVEVLSCIHGPYAFIYYHKISNMFYFGRDPFGRRSLLTYNRVVNGIDKDNEIVAISSVSVPIMTKTFEVNNGDVSYVWKELDVQGIYSLSNIDTSCSKNSSRIMNRIYWPLERLKLRRNLNISSVAKVSIQQNCFSEKDISVQNSSLQVKSNSQNSNTNISSTRFLHTLQSAINKRVQAIVNGENSGGVECNLLNRNDSDCNNNNHTDESSDNKSKNKATTTVAATVGVLFSGGIDSVLLSALLHLSMRDMLSPNDENNNNTFDNMPIDLLNVTFLKSNYHGDEASSPDRAAAIAALAELKSLFPTRPWRLVHIDVTPAERALYEDQIKSLVQPSDTHMDLNIGTALWFASRGKGYMREYTPEDMLNIFTQASIANAKEGSNDDENATTTAAAARDPRPPSRNLMPILRHGDKATVTEVVEIASSSSSSKDRNKMNGDSTVNNNDNNNSLSGSINNNTVIMCSAQSDCKRVSKAGCCNGACKRCCDRLHRMTTVSAASSLPYQEDATVDIASLDNTAAAVAYSAELALSIEYPNPCPVHRANVKQLDKMRNRLLHSKGGKSGSGGTAASLRATTYEEAPVNNDQVVATTAATVVPNNIPLPVCVDNNINDIDDDSDSQRNHAAAITAAAAVGTTRRPHCDDLLLQPYTSTCRALLVGIGADEQLAGYGRHRTVYLKAVAAAAAEAGRHLDSSNTHSHDHSIIEQAGRTALEAEMNMDMERLWRRNLGRDDRCISDNGKEAWFPYLDEEVVMLLQSLPVSQIADLSLAQGIGDKQILREAARLVGLDKCTELVKRAIQFGTRVAQHTNQIYNCSNRKGKGDTKL